MNPIITDIMDYGKKISLIREYLGYYTEEDLHKIFQASLLTDILKRYSYDEIESRLANTLTNTIDSNFKIGDIVLIKQAYKQEKTYKRLKGIIIGIHTEYENSTKLRQFNIYDVLICIATYKDGYSYDVKRYKGQDMYKLNLHVDNIEEDMNNTIYKLIDRPV